MLVLDYKTGTQIEKEKAVKGIVEVNDEGCKFGYFSYDPRDIHVLTTDGTYPIVNNSILEYCYFDGRRGMYILTCPWRKGKEDINIKSGRGGFPYSFSQRYEAIHSFDIFEGMQYLVNDVEQFDFSEYLPYTFGLEFETSSGFIPQDKCFRDGLIPLRDGSITGPEYSTTVLKGNEGINYLKQQLDTLKYYTLFDKECSLHMHIGCPVITKSFVWNLYVLLTIFQNELPKYVPYWTFESNRYKASRKNYCSKIPLSDDFNQLYKFIAGQEYEGYLNIPHKLDPDRQHKWCVKSRYFDFNFVNLMCYKSPKTLEFRFLRPTYHFEEITTWLLIFMGIIRYSYTVSKEIRDDSYKSTFDFYQSQLGKKDILFNLFKIIFPKELADKMIYRMKIIRNAHTVMFVKEDYAGLRHNIKEEFFNNSDFK